jgi:prevent-host-death family protein
MDLSDRTPTMYPSSTEAQPPAQPATFAYMTTVGVAELRQNLSKYLRLVDRGERLVVTDRNRPVAELGPPPSTGRSLDRLIAEGRVSPPRRRGLPAPSSSTATSTRSLARWVKSAVNAKGSVLYYLDASALAKLIRD